MAEINTVTIPIEEYFEMRRKAEETLYLANQLGEMSARFAEYDRRIFELERKLNIHG